MAKWKQMKMIVGSIMVGALLMPTMSITVYNSMGECGNRSDGR